MQNLIKIYYVVQELWAFSQTEDERTDSHSNYSAAHMRVVQYCLDFFSKNTCYTGTVAGCGYQLASIYLNNLHRLWGAEAAVELFGKVSFPLCIPVARQCSKCLSKQSLIKRRTCIKPHFAPTPPLQRPKSESYCTTFSSSCLLDE